MKYNLASNEPLEINSTLFVKGLGNYEGNNSQTAGVKTVQTVISEKLNKMINIIWQDLKTLRDNSKLIPGQKYRITDYVTTTIQTDTQSAGHVFDIIVTADSESVLNEQAKAIQHDGDTYFKDSDLSAWQLWYCLDNDMDRFSWAMNEGRYIDISFDGFIYTAKYIGTKSVEGNEYYLWYNKTVSKTHIGDEYCYIGTFTMDPIPGDFYDFICDNGSDDPFVEYSGYDYISSEPHMSETGKGVIYRMIDEFNNDIPYDFKNIQFKHPKNSTTYPYYYYTFASGNTTNNTDFSLSITNNCYSNTIKPYYYITGIQQINKNLFIRNNCHSNTLGENCHSNTLEENCHSNTLGENCHSNTLGKNCYSNTLRENCSYNSFGNSCYDNTFGNNCTYNSFGNSCYDNTFGNNCTHNSFGDSCYDNTFGNNCSYNKLGRSSNGNIFGNWCYNNSFGTECDYNTFGTSCSFNKFLFDSDDSTSDTPANYFQYNKLESGVQYCIIHNNETASSNQCVKNYNIKSSVAGTSSNKRSIIVERNRSYDTTVAVNTYGILKDYCEADLVA